MAIGLDVKMCVAADGDRWVALHILRQEILDHAALILIAL
jgi:hypothetical protein